jgi:hypothetical protein
VRPRHQLVSHVPVPPISDAEILRLPDAGPTEYVRRAMEELCGTVDLVDEADSYTRCR